MSAVKRTPIPLPGKAAKAIGTPSKAPKPAAKPIAQDDDGSSDESSDSSSSGSDNESVAAKTNGAKKPEVKKANEAKSASSSGASDDSSSSEEEDDEEEESSDEAESEKNAQKTAQQTKESAANEDTIGSENSSEDSESESESEESEEEATAKNAQTTSSSRLQTAQFRPARPFEPPSSFKLVKSGLNPSSNLAKLLQTTDLSQKQIWHITAPADIDIRQIRQFDRGRAALKKPAIEHKGVGYAFIPEEKATRVSAKLLVPTEKGYSAVPAEISETLHLQQVVNLPKLSEREADSTRSTGATQKFVERPEKPARPQPEGLRMRYKPYGYSGDMTGTIGSDNEGVAPVLKRKHGDADASAEAKSSKKSKKDKKHKEKSLQEDGVEGEPMEGVEPTAAAKEADESEKKKKKKEKKEKKEKKRKE